MACFHGATGSTSDQDRLTMPEAGRSVSLGVLKPVLAGACPQKRVTTRETAPQ
jgi:hypothetical protein